MTSKHPLQSTADLTVPLENLAEVRVRMDSLQQFLSESINRNIFIGRDKMEMVSIEISSAIQQIIVNGTALLACSSQSLQPPTVAVRPWERVSDGLEVRVPARVCQSEKVVDLDLKSEEKEEDTELDCDIVEIDAIELLAEHVHFCEICGKGFKRDANLRMHMRAHGNQFKTLEALSKPDKSGESSSLTRKKTRFSCPFEGCNRNKKHKKFRPLKSVICVRNHFKRSHCPKMYSCNRCNKKSFSVVSDLKNHIKHCGESRWKCSCGTSFSRKDKLFGHMALFEGHMPAVVGEEEAKAKDVDMVTTANEDEGEITGKGEDTQGNCIDNSLYEGLFEGLGSINDYNLEYLMRSPNSDWTSGVEGFLLGND